MASFSFILEYQAKLYSSIASSSVIFLILSISLQMLSPLSYD